MGHLISRIKATLDLFATLVEDFNPNFPQFQKFWTSFMADFTQIFFSYCGHYKQLSDWMNGQPIKKHDNNG